MRLNAPTEGFPWDDLRIIFVDVNNFDDFAKVPNGVEKLPKISTA